MINIYIFISSAHVPTAQNAHTTELMCCKIGLPNRNVKCSFQSNAIASSVYSNKQVV